MVRKRMMSDDPMMTLTLNILPLSRYSSISVGVCSMASSTILSARECSPRWS